MEFEPKSPLAYSSEANILQLIIKHFNLASHI